MEHAAQHGGEGLADAVDVQQGQGGIAQLTVLDLAAHEALNEPLNGLGRGIRHGAHGGLNGVRQHHDSALLGGRSGAAIAEVLDIHRLAVRLLERLMVEVHHRGIAVMLDDDPLNLRRQVEALGQGQAIGGMGRQDGGGNIGIRAVMGVIAALVLLEVQRALELADIMEIRAGTGQERIGADSFRRRLGQVRHDDGVMIGAGGFHQQTAQQGLIRIGQLQELGGRRQVEGRLEHRLESDCDQAADHAARHRPHRIGHGVVQIRCRHEAMGQHQRHVHAGHQHAADDGSHTLGFAGEELHGNHAADDAGHQEGHHFLGIGAVAARGQAGEDHGQGDACRQPDPGPKQPRQQHGAQGHRHQMHIDQLDAEHPQAHADEHHQHDDDHLARLAQGFGVEHVQHQHQQGDRGQHHQGSAAVNRQVDMGRIQQAQGGEHRNLIGADALAFPDDVLALLVDHRFHAVAGRLTGRLGGHLIHHHVRLDNRVEHHRHDGVCQIAVHPVFADGIDVVDGAGHLAFPDGGVQRVLHRRAHLADHGVEGFALRAQEHAGLIGRERNPLHHGLGIGYFLRAVAADAGKHGGIRRTAKALPILLHHRQLRKEVIQRHEDFLRRALLQVIGGLHGGCRGLAVLLRGDGILHVLGGHDGLMGNIAHLQAVPVRDAGQGKHGKQQDAAEQDDGCALGAGSAEPGHEPPEAAPAAAFCLSSHGFISFIPLMHGTVPSAADHQAWGDCFFAVK